MGTAHRGLLESQERLNAELEASCSAMEERLKRCLRRGKAERIHRLAVLAKLGREKGVFSPKRLAAETGWKYSVVYRDLQTLQDLDIAEKVKRGRYRLKQGITGEELEDAIARALAVKLAGERPGR